MAMGNIKGILGNRVCPYLCGFDATRIAETRFAGIADDMTVVTIGTFVDFESSIDGTAGKHLLDFAHDHRSDGVLYDLRVL